MKLDKTILTKLEKNKLIVREKSGRNVFVSLTESGRYVARLSGLLE
jgi:DNA-binding MarR family transcriptional regulator